MSSSNGPMPPRCSHIAALLLLGAGTVMAAQQPAAVPSPGAAALERRVEALFAGAIRSDGPGCAVGVFQDGATIFARGFGVANVEDRRPITAQTSFNLGSLSKPFTAVAALLLEQRGQLTLDDDIRGWVPELPDYGRPIRVRDLLQHTSGLRDFQALETLSGQPVRTMPEFLALIAAQRALNFSPGAQHEYSHSDYLMLGLIIERIAGAPFGDHVEREVLAPMGMKHGFVDDGRPRPITDRAFGHLQKSAGARVAFPVAWTVAGSNLYASVDDLARWDRTLDTPPREWAAVIGRMLGRPQLATGETIPYAYGLRLDSYRGLRTVSRGGFDHGTRTEVIRFPDQRFAVATLCNSDKWEPWRFGQAVADIYLSARMQPSPPRPAAPAAAAESAETLARFAGVYRVIDRPWSLSPIEIRNGMLGEVLFDADDDEIFDSLTPAGGGRFFTVGTTGNIGTYTFRDADAGAAARLEITWSGAMGVFSDSLERVADSALWRPPAAALAEYSGTWFSEELDTQWQFEPRGGRLVLRRRGLRDLTLWPTERDAFVRGFGQSLTGQLQFHRDTTGQLTHLTVSTPPGEESARGVGFVRLGVR